MKTFKKIVFLLIAVAMLTGMFSGCNDLDGSVTENVTATPTNAATAKPEGPEETPEKGFAYPMVGDDLVLTCWSEFNPDIRSTQTSADLAAVQLAERMTGVTIEWLDVIPPMADENLMILISGGDYPDMFKNALTHYTGTSTQAVEDGIFLDITDYIPEYAPNYMATLEANEDYYLNSVTDDGMMIAFCAFYDEYVPSEGLAIRSDWLEDLGLEVPETYEELEEVLKAFKTAYGASSPYMFTSSNFGYELAHGFGTSGGISERNAALHLYQVNGVVTSSYIQDGYLEYLTLMNSWYKQGLVSTDFATLSGSDRDEDFVSLIVTDQVGVAVVSRGFIGNLPSYGVSNDFNLMGIGLPVTTKGEITHFSDTSRFHPYSSLVISATSDNVETALRWADWWFTEEGILAYNYGEEGVTWEMVDGVPTFTDFISNYELDGVFYGGSTAANAHSMYKQMASICYEWRLQQYLSEDDFTTIDNWLAGADNANIIPTTVSLTESESSRYNQINTEIETYVAENAAKFINGQVPLSEWDKFKDTVISMGIEELIQIYQDSYNRYLDR